MTRDELELRLQRIADGHLLSLSVRVRISEGGDPTALLDQALQSLAGDADALRAFERNLARARLVTQH